MNIWGSAAGNLVGTLYFLFFQAAGIYFTYYLLSNAGLGIRLLCGSVLGAVLLQWLPVLCAFILDFTISGHLLALLLCISAAVFLRVRKLPHAAFILPDRENLKQLIKKQWSFLLLFLITLLLFSGLTINHTLLLKEDGFHTGQSTYGDMNMHLSFITSMAQQESFPPYYSISPGDKLCYPFLCDSISSSIYLFGASLRYSYILPMIFAMMQVMGGFYCFAYSWLKKGSKACLAFFLFFYNGGLGFLYFIDWSENRTYQFCNIFTEFYQTPTNLVPNNIRWVNMIADMLLPQRSTLFGYAVLFPCIYLLWRAISQKETKTFVLAALLAGSLPMINTHSFLGIAIISACFLLMHLYNGLYQERPWRYPGKWLILFFLMLMCLLQIGSQLNTALASSVLMGICLLILTSLTCLGIMLLIRYIQKFGYKELASGFGLFILITVFLALPQLCYWTFGQVGGEGFIRGHFNWGNQGDHYLWFYIKNWGVTLLLFIPAVINSRRKDFYILSAGFLLWSIAELVAFTPNNYDNNKLLYIGFMFFCCISADYGIEIYQRIKDMRGIKIWAFGFLFLSGISAFLTLGREWVSDYTLYSNAQIEVSNYITSNAPTDAVILTNSRHVNEVASLTGRDIVNGADVFLWPHGLMDTQRKEDVRMMYETPEASYALFQKYDVDYIVVSSWERADYEINDIVYEHLFDCVFVRDDIKLYQLQK